MRKFLIVIALCASAFMAVVVYRTSNQTRAAKNELSNLERSIDKEREAIAVLRAEWAYLNRPERLRQLVERNFASLELAQISEYSYGTANMVPFPPAAIESDSEFVEIENEELENILEDIEAAADGEWP